MSTITAPVLRLTAPPARVPGVTPRAVRPVRAVPTVRLTRRGRLALTTATLLTAVVAAVLAGGGSIASAGEPGAGGAQPLERVTVQPGDTLWAIALREAPGADPRETISRILELNAMTSAGVQAGQVLLMPAG